MSRERILALSLIPLIIMLAACAGSNSDLVQLAPQPGGDSAGPPVSNLPELSTLPLPETTVRAASDVQYELLLTTPLATSDGNSAQYTSGQLTLDPTLGDGLAWAIFGLSGFHTDGTIYPLLVKVERDNPVWFGFSDYERGAWQLERLAFGSQLGIEDGARLINSAGATYVAVLAYGLPLELTQLTLSVNSTLPGAPTAVLNIPAHIVQGAEAQFHATGSDPGDGLFEEFIYDFGDGSDPATATAPEEIVTHTYEIAGPVIIVLTVRNDLNRTAYDSDLVTIEEPAPPTAVLNVPPQVVLGYEAEFSATGSSPGDGEFTEFVYDFDDGSPVVTVYDPDEVVSHEFTSVSQRNVSLTVHSDLSLQDTDTVPVQVTEPFRELLIVYNSDIAESQDLAEYYASPNTGRAIDPNYMLGLAIGTNETNLIRANYRSLIRDPLITFLDANPTIKNGINYIVLMKGVPFKITDEGRGAVDSDLCMLYEDGNFPTDDRLWSGNTQYDFNNSQFYEALDGANKSFSPFTYTACDGTGTDYTVSYLVGRISAYTYDEAKESIDRALSPNTSGNGYVIMDTHEGWNSSETMADPVWPGGLPGDPMCLWELLDDAGYNYFLDNTYDFITPDELPLPAIGENVIGYTGWGVNHHRNGSGINPPSGKMYILEDFTDLNYLNGACWIVYESYAGTSFSWDGETSTHASQGQIADFIRMGGTVAAGNCYEPYTDGVPDERRVMERYLLKGDRWIEACYKGVRYFSWHTIVLGDPLCQVAP